MVEEGVVVADGSDADQTTMEDEDEEEGRKGGILENLLNTGRKRHDFTHPFTVGELQP